MFIRLRTFAFLLLSCTQLCLAVPTVEQGYDAFEQGHMATAVQIWNALAEQGNTTAQLNLAQLYRQGKTVQTDDREAVKWYRMAAKQGSDTATYNLLLMHEEGRATTQELDLALNGRKEPHDGALDETPANTITAPSPIGSWLDQLPAEQYLLQLAASSNPEALEKFRAKYLDTLKPQPQIVLTTTGRDLYMLAAGPFDTREQAKDVLGQLPGAVKKSKPWIGTVASLQQIVKPVARTPAP